MLDLLGLRIYKYYSNHFLDEIVIEMKIEGITVFLAIRGRTRQKVRFLNLFYFTKR